MVIEKIILMVKILVFANLFFITVRAHDNPYASEQCIKNMETSCRVKDPTALDCARAALKFWQQKLDNDDMQEYYEALYKKLNMGTFDTPIEFCHKKKFNYRQQCKDQLKDYFIPGRWRCPRIAQQHYAVRHAFFNTVLKFEDKANYKYNYENQYILIIHKNIEVMNDMDSPAHFCRGKYELGFEKPYSQDVTLFNIFNTDYNINAVQECFIAMETYCEVEDPTALDCARAAIKSWKQKLPHNDVQEYYEDLFKKLNMSGIRTPLDYCQNKKISNRKQCTTELNEYFTSTKCNKEEQRKYAVYQAFFNTVWSCACERNLGIDDVESSIRTIVIHKECPHSYKDKYVILIYEDIRVKSDMETPKEFCLRKYEPDNENNISRKQNHFDQYINSNVL